MKELAALLVAPALWAQAVSVGLRVGVPVTSMLHAEGPYEARAGRYTLGPLIEVRLWRGVGVGADFLVSRAGLATASAGAQRAGVWRWEAPVTLLYRFGAPGRPFVRAGFAVSRILAIRGASECGRGPFGERFYCLDGRPVVELRHRGALGSVAGGGMRWRFKKLWFEPEVRLTRWIDRNFGVRDSAVRSNLNQIGLLVGVVF